MNVLPLNATTNTTPSLLFIDGLHSSDMLVEYSRCSDREILDNVHHVRLAFAIYAIRFYAREFVASYMLREHFLNGQFPLSL